ncbi:MAG: hypothetical protein H0X26_09625 [Alphaproteobacteria bacterium]|nr:hypothetical protein [Alphaproteobacteria bacterium]
MPKKGDISFISQSGATLVCLLEWAHTVDVGFSKLLWVGRMSDLNFADYLEYLNNDTLTKLIALYVEAITDAKKFLSVAQKTVLTKPIAVIK